MTDLKMPSLPKRYYWEISDSTTAEFMRVSLLRKCGWWIFTWPEFVALELAHWAASPDENAKRAVEAAEKILATRNSHQLGNLDGYKQGDKWPNW